MKDCAGCHQWILNGAHGRDDTIFDPEIVARWTKDMRLFRYVPSLAVGFYRREWLERFLLEPHDIRPHLPATMPRFALSPEQARDIAAWLGRGAASPERGAEGDRGAEDAAAVALKNADSARGRQLLETKGCGSCHAFTGVPPLPVSPAIPSIAPPAIALAPDLRHARERFDSATLFLWVSKPESIKTGRDGSRLLMPSTPLRSEEAWDIVAYLSTADLAPLARKEPPARLPPLERPVRYEEVERKVLRKSCRHCHAEPDDALGDGGPGNTGGFGFAPRGLNLSEFEGIMAGSIDDRGERRSVLAAPSEGGTPLLVRALLARAMEEAGKPDPQQRGMPLGLPALSPEEIQLVDTWIAQGHRR